MLVIEVMVVVCVLLIIVVLFIWFFFVCSVILSVVFMYGSWSIVEIRCEGDILWICVMCIGV